MQDTKKKIKLGVDSLKKDKMEAYRQMIHTFSTCPLFPIFKDCKSFKPLEIGAQKKMFDLLKKNPDIKISNLQVRKFIRWYTTRDAYYKAVFHYKKRFNIQNENESTSDVSIDHLDYYLNKIKESEKLKEPSVFKKKEVAKTSSVVVEFKKKPRTVNINNYKIER